MEQEGGEGERLGHRVNAKSQCPWEKKGRENSVEKVLTSTIYPPSVLQYVFKSS